MLEGTTKMIHQVRILFRLISFLDFPGSDEPVQLQQEEENRTSIAFPFYFCYIYMQTGFLFYTATYHLEVWLARRGCTHPQWWFLDICVLYSSLVY